MCGYKKCLLMVLTWLFVLGRLASCKFVKKKRFFFFHCRLGEACNHIVALLFAVEDYTKMIRDGEMSCTSLPCEWNKPRKRKLSPNRINNLQPVRHQYDKKPRLAATPKPGLYKAGAPVSNSFLPNFLDNL